ncbi:MAG: 50S ribosomal protein L17 [Thermomicrobiaceae bacterium]|nr:50S ribosomal protein L17 [Thermomicrobiaceae bacterium]
MRHRVAGRKFSRTTNQRKQLFRNLAVSLILHERMTTTEAKAKTIRPIVEKLVSIAREDTEHHRRLVMSRLANERATAKLFEVLGPRFKDQPGGYTRIYKLGNRKGDNAPMSLIEFV